MKINIKVKYFSFGFLVSLLIISGILFFGIKYIKGEQKKEINKYLSKETPYLNVYIKEFSKIKLDDAILITDGKSMLLNEKRFLFINFWATWCAPCVEELPVFQKLILDKKISKLPIKFIFANNEKMKKQKKFIEKSKLELDFFKVKDSLPDIYDHNSIPSSYIFDNDSKIMYRIDGSQNWNSKIIKKFLIKIQG